MDGRQFELEILAPGRADVFLACGGAEVPWPLVEQLDRAGLRAVGPPAGCAADPEQVRAIMSGCAGALIVAPEPLAEEIASDLGMLRLGVQCGGAVDLKPLLATVGGQWGRRRPYAFLIGRLERDFRQARHAIRAAVEAAAGIPCLWIDDGAHRTNVSSIRERTRLLIQHAALVIADLSLGIESPQRENPSRAHEIGMSIGYGRPLILCSQEPRRYPYYSIGDMQMAFWASEDELEALIENQIRATPGLAARRVFNHQLPAPAISPFTFEFDPAQRFLGPNLRMGSNFRRLLARVGIR
jgi:hypothetical protein